MAGATYSTLFSVRRSRVGLAFGDLLTGYTVFLVKQNIYRDREVTSVSVCLTWHFREKQKRDHLGPRNLF